MLLTLQTLMNSLTRVMMSKNFEAELKEDFFKQLDLIKTKDEYVEPTVQDTETIEKETKKEDNEFLELATKFNEVDTAATKQKKQDHFDEY